MRKVKLIEIKENDSIPLTDDELKSVKLILKKDPELPIYIEGSVLKFAEYTVGEIRLDQLAIKIFPRNKSYGLNQFFKILQYIENPDFEEIESVSWSESNSDFGITDLSVEFCNSLINLTNYGLSGSYSQTFEKDKFIKGEIIAERYFYALTPIYGVEYAASEFTIDIYANQVIKSALLKLISIEGEESNGLKYQLLRDFDNVNESQFSERDVNEIIMNHRSSNPFYSMTLEISRKILFGLHMEYSNGDINWLAFLENSNEVFEKYIRTILKKNLNEIVTKWKKPKKVAQINYGTSVGEKSFIPDILIQKSLLETGISAVLDAKNKNYDPIEEELSDIITSADLYQIYFYCDILKARHGGLVYPANRRIEPIEITVDSRAPKIKLFSIDMSKSMQIRNEIFIQDVRRHILFQS